MKIHFVFVQKINPPFVYIRFIWLNENLLFSFRNYIKEKKKFDEVALFHSWFLRFIYFFKKGGEGMDEREEQILTDVYLVDFGHNTICKNYDNLFFYSEIIKNESCSIFAKLSKILTF